MSEVHVAFLMQTSSGYFLSFITALSHVFLCLVGFLIAHCVFEIVLFVSDIHRTMSYSIFLYVNRLHSTANDTATKSCKQPMFVHCGL